MARTITLSIDGDEISAQVFRQKVNAFLDMLHNIDRNVTEEIGKPSATSVKWVLESIHYGSPVVMTLRADPIRGDVDETVGDQVITTTAAGLQQFGSVIPTGDLPPYFTFSVLEDIHALTHIAQDGITGITVSTPEQHVELTKQIRANTERFLRPIFQHTGSVEGVLQMVSVAGGVPRFSVRDRLSGRAIRCTVPKERLPDVLAVFDRRVTVFGRVRTNERGDVLSIHMEDVQAFHREDELPSIRQVAGAFDLTSGKSIEEHLKRLRDAS